MGRTRKLALLIVGLAAFGAGVGLAALWSSRGGDPPQIDGFVYPQPKAVSPFALTAHDGSTLDHDDLRGKWTFVFFGYTYCPDVCPLTLAELNGVQRLLGEAGVEAHAQYVFVSVDPRRDTPERLASYVAHFNREFIGATGSEQTLKQLTQELGVLFAYPEGTSGSDYEVAHSASIELFDPNARLHAVFTAPHRAQTIAEDFRKIRRHWERRRS